MCTKEQTIWSIQGERLTEAFQKAGYATQIEYAEDDSAKQAMQIENMITKGFFPFQQDSGFFIFLFQLFQRFFHVLTSFTYKIKKDHPQTVRVSVLL